MAKEAFSSCGYSCKETKHKILSYLPKRKKVKLLRIELPTCNFFLLVFFVSSSNLAIFHGGLLLPMRSGVASGIASIRNLYRAAYRSITRKWHKYKQKPASDEEPKADHEVHKVIDNNVPVEVKYICILVVQETFLLRDLEIGCFVSR